MRRCFIRMWSGSIAWCAVCCVSRGMLQNVECFATDCGRRLECFATELPNVSRACDWNVVDDCYEPRGMHRMWNAQNVECFATDCGRRLECFATELPNVSRACDWNVVDDCYEHDWNDDKGAFDL
eukprot:246111_1